MVKLYTYCRFCRRKAIIEINDKEVEIHDKENKIKEYKKDEIHSFQKDCECKIKFTIGPLSYTHLISLLKQFPQLIGLYNKFDSIEKIFPVYFQKTFEEMQKDEEERDKKICVEIENKIKLLKEELKRYIKT